MEDTQVLVAALAGDPDPDRRRHAAEGLFSVRTPAAVAALGGALKDPSKGVRDAAFRTLTAMGGPGVAGVIVGYICDDDIVLRNLAAELLVRLGTTSIPALEPYLQHPHHDVRKFAVDILGLIGDEAPAAALVPLLEDPDENVVVSAVEALGNIRARDVLPGLYQAYDRHAFARAAVAEALGKIGEPAASGFLVRRLQEALEAPGQDPVLLFALIEALGTAAPGSVRDVLLEVRPRTAGRLRSALLHTLVQIARRSGDPLEFPPDFRQDWLAALSDPDPAVRSSAAEVLSAVPGADVSAALMGAFGFTAELDTFLLRHLPAREDAFDAAVQCLEQHRRRPLKGVITLLGRLTLDLTRTIMKSAVTERHLRQVERAFILIADRWVAADEETRAAIVDVLFRLDGDNAVEFLDAIMNDPDPWLRIHVIEVIAAIADPRAPGFIVRFLQDEDEMVREVATQLLEARGYPFLQPVPDPRRRHVERGDR